MGARGLLDNADAESALCLSWQGSGRRKATTDARLKRRIPRYGEESRHRVRIC